MNIPVIPQGTYYVCFLFIQANLVSADNPKQLIIALEPEAASIYCRQLRLKECIPDTNYSPPSTSRSPSTGAPKFKRSQGISQFLCVRWE